MKNEKKIIEILSEFTEVDPADIKPDSGLVTDLRLTSLDVIDMITAFEDEYDIEIKDKDIRQLHTVQDIDKYIEAHA